MIIEYYEKILTKYSEIWFKKYVLISFKFLLSVGLIIVHEYRNFTKFCVSLSNPCQKMSRNLTFHPLISLLNLYSFWTLTIFFIFQVYLWFWNEKCKNKPSLKLPKRLQIYPLLLPMSTEQMILYFKKILCWHLKKKRKLLKIFCKMRENLCLRYIEFLILNLKSKTLCKISFNINAAYDQHDGLYALFLCTLILDPNHYVKQ